MTCQVVAEKNEILGKLCTALPNKSPKIRNGQKKAQLISQLGF
jgi:hypothetical protein